MKNKFLLFFIVCIFLFFFVSAIENPIDSLMKKQGFTSEEIKNVSFVNKSVLPSEISISSVQDNNVEIQQVEYDKDGILKKMFIISFTEEGLSEALVSRESRNAMFLSFSGVDNLGSYVALSSGSITGLSSYVDFSGSGEIEIKVYINDKLAFISNQILSSNSVYDFDLQSENIDFFNVGDIISLRVSHSESINLRGVNSVVKIE